MGSEMCIRDRHCTAVGLSRFPLQQKESEEMGVDSSEVLQATQFVPLPVTSEAVARETRCDPVLARVHESIVKGWSARVDGDKPYYKQRRASESLQWASEKPEDAH